jgi:hypothetical protein
MYEGRRTYFFFADVEPKELGTFGVQAGIQLDDDSTLELVGHALAEARANVVGTIHERYEAGAVRELDGPRTRDFTAAANAAWRFVREPTLRLAFEDLGFSLHDRGDDAFLYAYRAVENARRFHADKVSARETTPVWPPLHTPPGTSEGQLQPLTDAATSIRHGDTKSAALAAARVNRDATLVLAEDVLRRLAQHEGVSW